MAQPVHTKRQNNNNNSSSRYRSRNSGTILCAHRALSGISALLAFVSTITIFYMKNLLDCAVCVYVRECIWVLYLYDDYSTHSHPYCMVKHFIYCCSMYRNIKGRAKFTNSDLGQLFFYFGVFARAFAHFLGFGKIVWSTIENKMKKKATTTTAIAAAATTALLFKTHSNAEQNRELDLLWNDAKSFRLVLFIRFFGFQFRAIFCVV